MRARREKHSSRSRYQSGPVYQTLAAGSALERQKGKRAVARRPASSLTLLAAPRSHRWLLRTIAITIHIMTLQK